MSGAPYVDFKSDDYEPFHGEEVNFTDLSHDDNSTIVDYSWDFDDGNNSNDQNPTHIFNTPGDHAVTLTVTNSDGVSGTKTKNIRVKNRRLFPDFTFNPTIASTLETINFQSESLDSVASIVSEDWDFGDGNTASGGSVNHSYNSEGEYKITLTVTDSNGRVFSKSKTITIKNKLPNLDFTTSPSSPSINDDIQFTNQSSDPDGVITSYTWEFGDGTSSSQESPTHSYDYAGEYTVKLVAEDNDGGSRLLTKNITVTSNVRSFTANSCIRVVEERINFTVDTHTETFEKQLNIIGENDGFLIDAKTYVSRHERERVVHASTAVQTGRDISFNADVYTSIRKQPNTIEKAKEIASSTGGTLRETDRKLVTIDGDKFVRIAKVKDFDSLEMLLDSIDRLGLSLSTANDFRIETSRELRLSIHRGESRREVIMYEKARDDITADPTLRLGR